jgi:uncharacterized membrane protein YkvA (DUF1232 family)
LPSKNQSAAAVFARLKSRARELKREIAALYLAARDPRTPWYAKALVGCVVAYALSPIDLIPDPIPVLGYLDDLLLLPLGIFFAVKLIPAEILADCRARAAAMEVTLPNDWRAAGVIILLWLLALTLSGYFLFEAFSSA